MADVKSQGRVLIVDADEPAAQKVGLALDGAGFGVAWTTFSPAEVVAYLKDFQPQLLLVHGELASPQVATLLARLESASSSEVPVALLCGNLADEPFVKPMRQGIVELLQEPFSARLHVPRLKLLLAELPGRPGEVHGRGAPNELQALVQHLTKARRTGGLVVGAKEEGRAFFVRGVLKSARHQQLSMHGALAAMVRLTVPWVFTEGAEGNAGVVELDAPEGFATTYQTAQPPTRRVQPVEVPDVGAAVDLPSSPSGLGSLLERGSGQPQGPSPDAGAPDPLAVKTPILFVDDEPAVVGLLATYFQKRGYPVATAVDGVEALQVLASRPFEAVIADLNMPRLDGWGLLRLVREDFRTHEIPIALYSAQDDYRESLRLLHAGAQAFFPKTLRLSVLELQVRELLEPRRRFLRLVDAGMALAHEFGSLGTQWVLRQLCARGFTGQLDARDAWASWRLWLEGGRLVQAQSIVGGATLTGDRALASFLSSKQVEGTVAQGGQASQEGFGLEPTEAILARNVLRLNEEHARAREDQLSRAKALSVNDDVYQLYTTVGPPAWMPIVRLLCEQKLTPAQVIQRLSCTPMDVAVVVKDLLRRGVVNLRA